MLPPDGEQVSSIVADDPPDQIYTERVNTSQSVVMLLKQRVSAYTLFRASIDRPESRHCSALQIQLGRERMRRIPVPFCHPKRTQNPLLLLQQRSSKDVRGYRVHGLEIIDKMCIEKGRILRTNTGSARVQLVWLASVESDCGVARPEDSHRIHRRFAVPGR